MFYTLQKVPQAKGRLHRVRHLIAYLLLKFRIRVAPDNENIHQDIFDRYLKKSTLINSMTLQQRLNMEFTFSIRFKDQKEQQHFLRELNALEGVEHAILTLAEEDLD